MDPTQSIPGSLQTQLPLGKAPEPLPLSLEQSRPGIGNEPLEFHSFYSKRSQLRECPRLPSFHGPHSRRRRSRTGIQRLSGGISGSGAHNSRPFLPKSQPDPSSPGSSLPCFGRDSGGIPSKSRICSRSRKRRGVFPSIPEFGSPGIAAAAPSPAVPENPGKSRRRRRRIRISRSSTESNPPESSSGRLRAEASDPAFPRGFPRCRAPPDPQEFSSTWWGRGTAAAPRNDPGFSRPFRKKVRSSPLPLT